VSKADVGTLLARWKTLTRLGLAIAAIASSIFIPPPAYAPDSGSTSLVPLVRFSVSILSALILVGMLRWNQQRHLRFWSSATAVSLAIVGSTYFFYNARLDDRTAIGPDGTRVVIGTEYTPTAAAYVRANPSASSPTDLLDASPCVAGSACSAEMVWTGASIASSKRVLGVLFVAGALFLAIALLSAVQCTLLD
jgi:hypothetical protein